jgi:hypothetical protein
MIASLVRNDERGSTSLTQFRDSAVVKGLFLACIAVLGGFLRALVRAAVRHTRSSSTEVGKRKNESGRFAVSLNIMCSVGFTCNIRQVIKRTLRCRCYVVGRRAEMLPVDGGKDFRCEMQRGAVDLALCR